jgi:hypothetical protein
MLAEEIALAAGHAAAGQSLDEHDIDVMKASNSSQHWRPQGSWSCPRQARGAWTLTPRTSKRFAPCDMKHQGSPRRTTSGKLAGVVAKVLDRDTLTDTDL